MISQALIKAVVPWLLMALWIFQFRDYRSKGAELPALYCVIFAGFSSNFTSIYREFGQVFSLLLALLFLVGVLKRRALPRFTFPLIGMAFFIGLSLIGNSSELAYSATINFISVSLVAAYVVRDLRRSDVRDSVFRMMVIIAFVLSLIAIGEGVLLDVRAEATFSNPNYLAFFLGVALSFVFVLPGRRLRWLFFGVISLGIYFTQSRAGFVFPLLAVGINLFALGLRRALLITPLLVALAISALFVDFSALKLGRDVESSDVERFLSVEAGIQMTREHPISGVGWGRYLEEFWSALSRSRSIVSGTQAAQVASHRDMVSHNDFVRVFAELGVLGGVYFLSIVFWSLRCTAALQTHLRYSFAISQLGALAFSLTHNNLNSSLFWVIFLFPIAVALRSAVPAPRREGLL